MTCKTSLQLMKKYVFNFHRSVEEWRGMNKNIQTKELGLYLRTFDPAVNTWEILKKLSLKLSFVGSVTILGNSNMRLDFNGRINKMASFWRLKAAEVRDLILFDFSSCLDLEVLTEIGSSEVMDQLLPLLYTLPKNLIKFTCLHDKVSFIPNIHLLVFDTIHFNIMNEDSLIKTKKLKKLCYAIIWGNEFYYWRTHLSTYKTFKKFDFIKNI